MRLLSSRIILILILFGIFGCFESKKTVNFKQFADILNEMGYEEELHGKSVVILHSSECNPYLDIIKRLNQSRFKDQVILVIIDKFESRFNIFLDQNNIELLSIRDPEGFFIKNGLISFTPVAVTFYEDNETLEYNELHEFVESRNLKD